jgi:hypothetical protein
VSQNKWLQVREDKVPGQYYHLTQIPFDIEINHMTGLALVYQIFLHFGKSKIVCTGDVIVNLAKERFKTIQIDL